MTTFTLKVSARGRNAPPAPGENTMEGLLASLIVGGIAGWLAGMIMKGKGQGIVLNIIIGIIGGVVGGWLFGLLGTDLGAGIVGSVVTATIGAVLLLWIVGKVKG
jgi:uncharacterized membrane protein YeaQ/YmgE (transglycosylase-associated protein family)